MIQRIRSGLFVPLVPLVLVLAAVRLVLNPWFVEFEYRTPGFPKDPFGFSREERLHYSRIALDYLLNDQGISFLGDLRFPQGQQAPSLSCQFMDDCTRLYNERELHHMEDVKAVVQLTLRVWYLAIAVLAVGGIWAWRGGWWNDYRRALGRGGWLTVALIAGIILIVLVAFGVFFVFFHQIFFESGTWTFYYSDTLIRLFPERFWRDTFIVVGLLAAGLGALSGYLFNRKNRI